MIIDNYYNYITLTAFEHLYKYESKKSISVETLKLFRSELLKEVLDIYKNGKGHNYLQERDQWQGEISFTEIDEDIALKNFLEEYEEYFYLDNDIVNVYEEVSFDDLSELVRQIRVKGQVSSRFDIIECTKKLRDILGISTIDKFINEYSKIEEKLQDLYYKLFTPDDSKELRKEIKALLFLRFNFFDQLSKMPLYRVDAIRMAASNYRSENDTATYDKYPIDLPLWKSQFEDSDDFLSDIDARVYDITQYAIFGKAKNVLYMSKLNEDIDQFYWTGGVESSQEIDPIKDYTDVIETDMLAKEQFADDFVEHPEHFATFHDPSDEFWVLYINYLNNLNRFMDIYGASDELLFAKKRLLYALDKPTVMLFDENNFKSAYEETKSIELDEEPFSFFIDEIYFMAQEAFMIPSNEYTIRKLLFVGTYYNLTKDQELKEIIEEFSNDSRFEFFYEIMINNCANKTPESSTEDIKKLILKPTDKNTPKE